MESTTANELHLMAEMMGAQQQFTDAGLVSMLCPDLAGKTLAMLTAEERQRLMAAAEAFSFPEWEREDDD